MDSQTSSRKHRTSGGDSSYRSIRDFFVGSSDGTRLPGSRSTSDRSQYLCPENAPFGSSTATIDSYGLDGLCGNTLVCETTTTTTTELGAVGSPPAMALASVTGTPQVHPAFPGGQGSHREGNLGQQSHRGSVQREGDVQRSHPDAHGPAGLMDPSPAVSRVAATSDRAAYGVMQSFNFEPASWSAPMTSAGPPCADTGGGEGLCGPHTRSGPVFDGGPEGSMSRASFPGDYPPGKLHTSRGAIQTSGGSGVQASASLGDAHTSHENLPHVGSSDLGRSGSIVGGRDSGDGGGGPGATSSGHLRSSSISSPTKSGGAGGSGPMPHSRMRSSSSHYQGRRLSKEMFAGLDAEAGVHFDAVVFIKEVIYHLFHPLALPLVWYLEGGMHGVRNRKFWWDAGAGSQGFVLSQLILGGCFFAMNGLCFLFGDMSTYVIVMVNVQWLIRNMVVGAKYAFTPAVERRAMATGRVPDRVLTERMLTGGWKDPLRPRVIKRQLLLAAVRLRLTLSSAAFVLPPRTPSAPLVAMMTQLLEDDSEGEGGQGEDMDEGGGGRVDRVRGSGHQDRGGEEKEDGQGEEGLGGRGEEGDAGVNASMHGYGDDVSDDDGGGGGGGDSDGNGDDDGSDRDSDGGSSQGDPMGDVQEPGEAPSIAVAAGTREKSQQEHNASGIADPRAEIAAMIGGDDGHDYSRVGTGDVAGDGTRVGSGHADGGGDDGGVGDGRDDGDGDGGGHGRGKHKGGRGITGGLSTAAIGSNEAREGCMATCDSHADAWTPRPSGSWAEVGEIQGSRGLAGSLVRGVDAAGMHGQEDCVSGRQQAGEKAMACEGAQAFSVMDRGETGDELASVTVDGMGPLLVDIGGGKMLGFPFVGLMDNMGSDGEADGGSLAGTQGDVWREQEFAGASDGHGAVAGVRLGGKLGSLPHGEGVVDGRVSSGGGKGTVTIGDTGDDGGVIHTHKGDGKEEATMTTNQEQPSHLPAAGTSHSALQVNMPAQDPVGSEAPASHPLGFLTSLRWLLGGQGRSARKLRNAVPAASSQSHKKPGRCQRRKGRRLEQEWMDSCGAGCADPSGMSGRSGVVGDASSKLRGRGKSSLRTKRHKSGLGSKKPSRVIRPAARFSHHLPVRLFAAHLILSSSDVTRRTHLIHSFVSRHSGVTTLALSAAYVAMPFVGQLIDGDAFTVERVVILALSTVLAGFSILSNIMFMFIGVMDIRRRLWLTESLSRLLMDNHRRVPGALTSSAPCVTKEGVTLPDCGKGPGMVVSPQAPGVLPASIIAGDSSTNEYSGLCTAGDGTLLGNGGDPRGGGGGQQPQGEGATGQAPAGASASPPLEGEGRLSSPPVPIKAVLLSKDGNRSMPSPPGRVAEDDAGAVIAAPMATYLAAGTVPRLPALASAGMATCSVSQPATPVTKDASMAAGTATAVRPPPYAAEGGGLMRVPIDLTKPESLLAWWALRQLLGEFGHGFFARTKFYTSLFALFCVLLVGFLLGKLLAQGTVDMSLTLVVVYNMLVFAVLLSLMVWPGGSINAANVGHEADLLELKMGLSLKLRADEDTLPPQDVDDVTAAIDMLDAILALVKESNVRDRITIVGFAAGEQMIGALLAVGATGIAIAAEQLVNIFSS
eukprot:jgi/Mesvir1/14347/Mv09755-RA.2